MSTRPGDLDPGCRRISMREDRLRTEEMDELVNRRCGLLGVSGRRADMRELLARRGDRSPAAVAVDAVLLPGQKRIGAFAAALGGLDTLVFSGGIGEQRPRSGAHLRRPRRSWACASTPSATRRTRRSSRPTPAASTVRVIPTDEEVMIARAVQTLLR